ncbi:stealth conserved region 3 domain-containing protein [Pseudomonas putida]|uniref:stealth conserved region 3 domain-containing protein n=1 Tax=Pseudomonas putida TaxID=303 RepID=UPI00390630AC
MNSKPVKYKKLRKFFRDPNMFFYDMFRKRVFKGAPPAAIKNTEASPQTAVRSVDLLEVNRLGLPEYIRKYLNAGIGAEDGVDPNSLVLWSGYLNGLISFIAGLRESTPTNVTIYTLGGGYSVAAKVNERFDAKAVSSALAQRPDFVVELCNILGETHVLHFYLYDLAPTGEATMRSGRAWQRRFPIDRFDEIYAPKTKREDYQAIDAVYTWVNHADIGWQKLWTETFPEEGFDPDRYTNNDELRYSLRSLNKYAPWLNKIYIVSNCQRPEWLRDDKKVVWVSHEAIFPDASVLPTFNSHAIEACLHKIPGLSENFIYLNDDFVLGHPCLPSDFFDEIGRSLAYFEPYGMADDEITEETPDYLVAASNSRKLLRKLFPSYQAKNLHRHVPYCLKKSILEKIEQHYSDAFSTTRAAKRRSLEDINLTSFLYHHFAYASGLAVKADAPGIIIRPTNIEKVVNKERFKYKLICFNDGNGSAEDTTYKNQTQNFFNHRLFQSAPWERHSQMANLN